MAIDFRGERLDVFTVDAEDFAQHLVRYDFARQRAHGKVLDLACGVGYGSYFLCSASGVESVAGADISEQSIGYATKTFKHSKLRFSIESATKTNFPDASFDTIVSLETVEHLKDVPLFFNEVKRLIRPGGTLVMSVPNKKFFLDAGFANEFHFNEMYFNDLSAITARFFGTVTLFYQRFPQDRYERLSPKPEPHATGKPPLLLRFVPRPVKELGKLVLSRVRYLRSRQQSVPNRYGFNFDKFLADNAAFRARYTIGEIVDDLYDRVPGNFIVVWQKEGSVAGEKPKSG